MRKVIEARLHQAFFAHGTGNLKAYLNTKEYLGMVIYKTDNGDGIDVTFKGVNFWVPAANIVGLVYAPEDNPTAVVTASKSKAA